MKRLVACLTTLTASAVAAIAVSAEGDAAVQQLEKVMESDQLSKAVWIRQPDTYTLQLVLDVARFDAKEKAIVAANKAELAADPPSPEDLEAEESAYFIRNAIASLRGLTPWFPCGKRKVGGRLPGQRTSEVVMFDKDNRVSVWLLKADGTQILPSGYQCAADPMAVDVQYTFSAAESRQAVAAAVRIDREYYIERL